MVAQQNAKRVELDDVGTSIENLAERLAHELDLAAVEAEKCQEAVSELVERSGAEGAVLRLQALDGLTQHLIELARLLARMAENDQADKRHHIFDGIRLADMKRRLSGVGHAAVKSDGELELW